MRPVNRKSVPVDSKGMPKTFAVYKYARADLIEVLGRYCSFCERHIATSLHVEHVLPKDHFPELICEWSNFLLACVNCNSTKGATKVSRKLYLFPDQDNTFRALQYHKGGKVTPHISLLPPQKGKATRLISLIGLDRLPTNNPTASDLRWVDRHEAWGKATKRLDDYKAKIITIDHITELCLAKGNWSIWMTVFMDFPEVRVSLINAFLGTSDCFGALGEPIQRHGGYV